MNITESLQKITDLTTQNLKILEALNSSFYTRGTHVQTDIDGVRFNIPSYLSLENKINHLQDAFDNLVHGAKTGDAWMNYDGNSKEIVLKSYLPVPNPVTPYTTSEFLVKDSDFFKDMLSPVPYLKFTLADLPDNVGEVLVKKIVFYNQQLVNACDNYVSSNYPNTNSATFNIPYSYVSGSFVDTETGLPLEKGKDYSEYDTIYKMPIRQSPGLGEYIITDIISDRITEDLDEILVVEVDRNTTFLSHNGSLETPLTSGCILTNHDGACKLEVLEVNHVKHTLKLKVLHGSYVHFIADQGTTNIAADASKLVFLSDSNVNSIANDKTLDIPLEEDGYIYVVIAPVTQTTRIQSQWGTGTYIKTALLTKNDNNVPFYTYYKQNVKNIGDTIAEMVQSSQRPITDFSSSEFKSITDSKPVLEKVGKKTIDVVQINNHLNDSESAKNIRSLYSQKKHIQIQMNDVQSHIKTLEAELATTAFDDQQNTRSIYEQQIIENRSQYNELYNSFMHIVDSITTSANNSQIPIEDAKFRIRGYIDVETTIEKLMAEGIEIGTEDVLGVQYRYRYKNPDIPKANVSVVDDFLFSEWVEINNPLRKKIISYSNGEYTFRFEDASDSGELYTSSNEPKFNQVDIPIKQSEKVDVQARIIWTFGYPHSATYSDWSDVVDIEFPDELAQDIQIKTIIDENNDDIETYRFYNVLKDEKVLDHVWDKVQDQDVTFWHKPENISSGFYTEERRIIPLRDKLEEMDKLLQETADVLKGTTGSALKVEFLIGDTVVPIYQDIQNLVQLAPYNSINPGMRSNNAYFKNISDGPVHANGVIRITNVTKHNVHLYSMFPGPRDMAITELAKDKKKYETEDFNKK